MSRYSPSFLTKVSNWIGSLAGLKTAAKGNLVAAINEHDDKLGNLSGTVGTLGNDIKNIVYPTSDLDNTPILTFIDDDVTTYSYDNWKVITQEKGINISFATVPNWLGKYIYAGHSGMTFDHLKELYDAGNELLSHGWDSLTVSDYVNEEATIQQELNGTRQWLIDNGFTRNEGYNYLVYPQGLGSTNVAKVKSTVKRFYKYGINVTESIVPNGVFDSYNVARVTSDGMSFATLKSYMDQAIASNGWVIMLSHAHHMVDYDNNDFNTWAQRYRDVIDYARANNFRIMTFGEAIKLRGNALSIGDFDNEDSFYVNQKGKTNLKTSVNVTFKTTDISTDIDLPIESYDQNSETVVFCAFNVPACGNSAGTMRVVRGGPHFSYALFMPIDSSKIYKRKWDDNASPAVWTPWLDISSPPYKQAWDQTGMDASIESYELYKETIVECGFAVPACGNSAGVMKVYRGGNHFSYATFHTVTTFGNHMYKRNWDDYASPAQWEPWELISKA
jgi:peptidoglycan/xylan/chitin deacetylase (PgdA/CDA1 family)